MITTAPSRASNWIGCSRGKSMPVVPSYPSAAERMTTGRWCRRRPRPPSDRGYRLACRTRASGHFGDVPANRSVISSRIPALPGPRRKISRAMAFGTRGRSLGQHEISPLHALADWLRRSGRNDGARVTACHTAARLAGEHEAYPSTSITCTHLTLRNRSMP